MDFYPSNYNSRHWMALPAPVFGNAPAGHNYFQVKMTGIAQMDTLSAAADGSWVRGDLIMDGYSGMGLDKIIERAKHLLPPLPNKHWYAFVPVQWTVQVALNAILNTGKWEASGYAVHAFALNRKANTLGGPLTFRGVNADVAVRDKDGAAQLYRVSYDVDMYGYFVTELAPVEE